MQTGRNNRKLILPSFQ